MKKIIFLIVLFPIICISQTYTVTTNPGYISNTSTYTVKQVGTGSYENPKPIIDTESAKQIQNVQSNISNSFNQAAQRYAQRAAAQAIIDENRRIEKERQYREQIRLIQTEKKRIEEEKIIEEKNNPNSILNKIKNTKSKQKNEDLKNVLAQMELLLAEKEKIEKEKLEKERLEKEILEKAQIAKKVLKNRSK